MEIDSTRSSAAALGGQTVQGADTELDRDAFMRLLVAQIRNQDPMDPMDTREMMSQLTQLTSVEHLIGIEDGIGSLQIASASIANAQVADFVGKTVTADTSHLRLGDTGSAPGAYELDGSAEHVTLTIRNAEGEVVRTVELGEQLAGTHGYTWDGNDDAGNRLPPGNYRAEIRATDADGTPVASRTRVTGRVTGVSYEDGYPELLLEGGYHVAMGDVREVASAPGAPTTTTTSASRALSSYATSAHVDTDLTPDLTPDITTDPETR